MQEPNGKLNQLDADRLAQAIELANIPVLLMVLVQLTGDLHWLGDEFRTKRARGMDDNDSGGHSDEVQTMIRAAAVEAILAWRGGRPVAMPNPSREFRLKMLATAMGEPIPDEYDSIIGAELAAVRDEPVEKLALPKDFKVIIIGAGVSGLCAAINLQQAGIPFTILEKSARLGGIWRDNRYPGAGVDTPNHLYSFANAPYDWSMYYALRDELHAYLEHVADQFSLRQHIRFGTAVKSASYDSAAQQWTVALNRIGWLKRIALGQCSH